MLSFDEIDLGAIMVRMLIRYMWSEIDSALAMPKRTQPALLVVFSRSRRWKKGTGEDVFSAY
jgi:hypothetical protein